MLTWDLCEAAIGDVPRPALSFIFHTSHMKLHHGNTSHSIKDMCWNLLYHCSVNGVLSVPPHGRDDRAHGPPMGA